jgi:hypothetical protein
MKPKTTLSNLSRLFNTTPEIYLDKYVFVSYTDKRGKSSLYYGQLATTGNITKKSHYSYVSDIARDKALEIIKQRIDFIIADKLEAKNKAKAFQDEAKSNINSIVKIGTIFQSTWGYEQTNVDFFKVLEVNKSTVKVVQLKCNKKAAETWETYTVTPSTEVCSQYLDIMTKRLSFYQRDGAVTASFSVNSYSSASIWDGKPQRISCYA